MGESARNKLGLSRHETDDVTGDMREGISNYRSAASKLTEAVKALESAEASERKADARRKEALRALGDDDALIEACLSSDERTDRFDRTEGWALEPLRAVRSWTLRHEECERMRGVPGAQPSGGRRRALGELRDVRRGIRA